MRLRLTVSLTTFSKAWPIRFTSCLAFTTSALQFTTTIAMSCACMCCSLRQNIRDRQFRAAGRQLYRRKHLADPRGPKLPLRRRTARVPSCLRSLSPAQRQLLLCTATDHSASPDRCAGFGREAEGGYSEKELEFGKLVAAQVAVALDNALRYDESLSLQKELARERDRLQLVLEVNNSVVSNLELHDLFRAISSSLRRLISHDSGALLLPDPRQPEMLRVYALDFPDGRGFVRQDMLLPISATNPGKAFREGKPILAGTAPGYYPFSADRMHVIQGEGIRTSMVLPLVHKDSSSPVGVLTLASRAENAFSQGDLDFLWQVAQQIAIGVKNALEHRKLSETAERVSEQKSYLEEEIRSEQDFEDIVGTSSALRFVLQQVETVAPIDSTVLIQGETGTGKELIARAIHDRSSRRGRTFVKINCAAIPMGLLESELFGHERGAFTGAIARKIGRFELAHQGTLFLDEIGDIPLELQPKLLRVLQEQEFERLGSTSTQKVDVRVIAATNQGLHAMVSESKFRGDLYYRLNVFPIQLPPLRERAETYPCWPAISPASTRDA